MDDYKESVERKRVAIHQKEAKLAKQDSEAKKFLDLVRAKAGELSIREIERMAQEKAVQLDLSKEL